MSTAAERVAVTLGAPGPDAGGAPPIVVVSHVGKTYGTGAAAVLTTAPRWR